MQLHLRQFKERGVVRFDRVFSIPSEQRIPALIKDYGLEVMAGHISGVVGVALNAMNLRIGMNTEQLIDLAIDILEEAQDDNLAMEDLLLFLQQLVRGKRGKIYDRMDSTVFFELFAAYREERHVAILKIREEQAAQHQALGDCNRISADPDYEQHRDAMRYYLNKEYGADQGTDHPYSPPGA